MERSEQAPSRRRRRSPLANHVQGLLKETSASGGSVVPDNAKTIRWCPSVKNISTEHRWQQGQMLLLKEGEKNSRTNSSNQYLQKQQSTKNHRKQPKQTKLPAKQQQKHQKLPCRWLSGTKEASNKTIVIPRHTTTTTSATAISNTAAGSSKGLSSSSSSSLSSSSRQQQPQQPSRWKSNSTSRSSAPDIPPRVVRSLRAYIQ